MNIIEKLKQELDEIEQGKIRMNINSGLTDSQTSFQILSELSVRKNSRFKILGNSEDFIIKAKSDNIIIGCGLLIIVTMPTLFLIENPLDVLRWTILSTVIIGILTFFRLYPSTNNIRIDSRKKIISIKSNNLIGQLIIPNKKIDFRDITKFFVKARSIRTNGKLTKFNRIYISHKATNTTLIDLHNGPTYFVNHNLFINSVENIIKKTTHNTV
jgi:hypothetical protein